MRVSRITPRSGMCKKWFSCMLTPPFIITFCSHFLTASRTIGRCMTLTYRPKTTLVLALNFVEIYFHLESKTRSIEFVYTYKVYIISQPSSGVGWFSLSKELYFVHIYFVSAEQTFSSHVAFFEVWKHQSWWLRVSSSWWLRSPYKLVGSFKKGVNIYLFYSISFWPCRRQLQRI